MGRKRVEGRLRCGRLLPLARPELVHERREGVEIRGASAEEDFRRELNSEMALQESDETNYVEGGPADVGEGLPRRGPLRPDDSPSGEPRRDFVAYLVHEPRVPLPGPRR